MQRRHPRLVSHQQPLPQLRERHVQVGGQAARRSRRQPRGHGKRRGDAGAAAVTATTAVAGAVTAGAVAATQAQGPEAMPQAAVCQRLEPPATNAVGCAVAPAAAREQRRGHWEGASKASRQGWARRGRDGGGTQAERRGRLPPGPRGGRLLRRSGRPSAAGRAAALPGAATTIAAAAATAAATTSAPP